MSVVESSTEIEASPQAVWEVIMDPAQLGEWVTIHRRIQNVSDGAPTPGFRMDQTMCLRGANFKVHWLLSECDAPQRALWEGAGPARSKATIEYRLEPHERGTRFRYRNEFRPPLGPLGAVASRALIGGISQREAERSLARLKQLLEERQR